MIKFSAALLCAGLLAGSCRRADTALARAADAKAAEPEVAWRSLGSWSGHGNTQTESFTSDSGSIRVEWSTTRGPVPEGAATHESARKKPADKKSGTTGSTVNQPTANQPGAKTSIAKEMFEKGMSAAPPADASANAGAGAFRLTIHSAISGRPLMEAVDQQGPGNGTSFVHEDPRVFFAVVDSTDLDWSFSLQEAVLVERKRP